VVRLRREWQGEEVICLVALSTFSLARMPLWSMNQRRVIGIGIVEKVVTRVRINATRGCEEEDFEMTTRVAGSRSRSKWNYRETKGGW